MQAAVVRIFFLITVSSSFPQPFSIREENYSIPPTSLQLPLYPFAHPLTSLHPRWIRSFYGGRCSEAQRQAKNAKDEEENWGRRGKKKALKEEAHFPKEKRKLKGMGGKERRAMCWQLWEKRNFSTAIFLGSLIERGVRWGEEMFKLGGNRGNLMCFFRQDVSRCVRVWFPSSPTRIAMWVLGWWQLEPMKWLGIKLEKTGLNSRNIFLALKELFNWLRSSLSLKIELDRELSEYICVCQACLEIEIQGKYVSFIFMFTIYMCFF